MLMLGSCPRCGFRELGADYVYSLQFNDVKICGGCDREERNNGKRPWRTHPEIASYEQKLNLVMIRAPFLKNTVDKYFGLDKPLKKGKGDAAIG